jgi:hypothetical protein
MRFFGKDIIDVLILNFMDRLYVESGVFCTYKSDERFYKSVFSRTKE